MPKLIFFIGHAGCGKTTISKEIAKNLKEAVYLDRDTIGSLFVDKMLMMKGLSPDDRDSDIYHKEFRDLEYNAMLKVAVENLQLGKDVIMVSPFTKEVSNPNWLREFLVTYQLEGIKVNVISVYLSDIEIQRKRIISRNATRDKWKLENWNIYKEKLNKIEVKWDNVNTLYFDNSQELKQKHIDEILMFLKTT